MSHLTKQDILNEIKRTAKENGGKPLGVSMFEKETGIKPYDWGQYWARFGDAQEEAGFTPNTLQTSYDDDFILEKTLIESTIFLFSEYMFSISLEKFFKLSLILAISFPIRIVALS